MDFEALYRGESPAPGLPALGGPPWDTKAPKESVLAWQEEGLVHGDVLDIGCGFGDNAVFLAQQGHTVTALDISPTALITAERRAHDAGVTVTFGVADATRLDGYVDAFDTVVDSAMYHCLSPGDRIRYAAAVHRATRPGARLLLSCFSEKNPAGPGWRRPGVSEQSLCDTLGGAGWAVLPLRPFTVVRDDESVLEFWLVQAERVTTSG